MVTFPVQIMSEEEMSLVREKVDRLEVASGGQFDTAEIDVHLKYR